MTAPSPAPSGTKTGTFGGITLTVPETGSSSSASKYGMGVWGDQEINPGDLPFIASIIGSGGTVTGDSIVKAFASANANQIGEIQYALYLGGFYPKTYNPTSSFGVISPQDVTAFANAVTLAGQSGGAVSDLLVDRAKYGAAAGVTAAQSLMAKSAKKTVTAIPIPATGDLEAQAMTAFQNTLGKKAKPHEAAAFAAAYQAMYAGIERGNLAAQQQATQTTGVGLTAGEAQGFGEQLQHIGEPLDISPQVAHGINNGLGPTVPQEGFGAQLDQLQSLGQAVTAAAAGKTPTLGGGGPSVVTEEQPEDPSVAAANFARNQHPKAAAKNDIGGAVDMFLNLLGGVGGG